MNLKELLKQRVDDGDLLPALPQWFKDKNTEIVKTYREGYEQGKKDAVRHGRWIDTGSGQECSACKEIQYGYDSGRYYCQNCGAKMEWT